MALLKNKGQPRSGETGTFFGASFPPGPTGCKTVARKQLKTGAKSQRVSYTWWYTDSVGLTQGVEASAEPRLLMIFSQTKAKGIDGFLSSFFMYSERSPFFSA